MATVGKKYKNAREQLVEAPLPSREALSKIKDLAPAKFDESIDVNVVLGIDPAKSDQNVRGSVVLPHGIGKEVKVAVFAKGEYADEAQKAGADYVGAEDLISKIESGWLDFNYTVATPDMMGAVGRLAKILGPRGLLPNKKIGTVTFDVAGVISELKSGRKFFKNDKSGSVNFVIGKVSFDVDRLNDNLMAFIKALATSRPSAAKGKFIKKVTVSSTMGVGIQVDLDELKI